MVHVYGWSCEGKEMISSCEERRGPGGTKPQETPAYLLRGCNGVWKMEKMYL